MTLPPRTFLLLACLPCAHLHAAPVSFAQDIQPMLEQSCLPCHNATKSEGGLILENPKAMLAGGDNGEVLSPNHALESLIYQTATRKKKPFMPPEANKAKAPHLNSAQLELLRRWIDEGATGNPRPKQSVAWKAMPDQVVGLSALALTSDAHYGAAARGNVVTVYDLPLQREVARFVAHPDIVSAASFSPDGNWLATGSFGEVKIWCKTRSPLTLLPEGAGATATRPDGARLAAILPDGTVQLTETSSKKQIAKLQGDRALLDAVAAAEMEFAGAKFELDFLEAELKATIERVGKITTDLEKATKEHTALLPKRADMEKAIAEATAKRDALLMERDAGDDTFMAETGKLDLAKKIELEGAAALKTAEASKPTPSPEPKSEASTSQEATKAAAKKATDDRLAAEAALKTAKEALDAKQKLYSESIKALGEAAGALSSAKTLEVNVANFATVLAQFKKDQEKQTPALETAKAVLAQAEIKNTEAARAAQQYQLPPAEAVAFHSDGTAIFTKHTDGRVRAWHGNTGAPLADTDLQPQWELARTIGNARKADSPIAARVNALAFSPDGKVLATGSGEPSRSGEIKLWEPLTGALLQELPKPHKDAVLSLNFSRDGKWLASGSADRAVRVWEVASGKMFRNLEAHGNHVLAVNFRADARRLASAGADNVVKTWDVQNSDVIASVTGFTKEVNHVFYLGLGDELLATSGTPLVRVFKDSGTEIRAKTEGFSKFITAAAVAPDGKTQLVGDAAGALRMLNKEGKILAEWMR